MEFIETTLTLVMHNTTFNAELSKNTDPAADVNKELSKATNPAPDAFLKLLIAEFNRHSSSAAVTQNALAVKLKCYALLLFASNSGLDDGKLDMEILHEPVTLPRSFIARSMLSQKTETIYQSISRCLGCYCSKVITMSDNVITLPFSVESFSVHDNKGTMQDDCSSCNKRQEHEKSICVQKASNILIVYFKAGLKDEKFHAPITTREGVSYRLEELILKEQDNYQCWTRGGQGNIFAQRLIFDSSQNRTTSS